MALNSTPIYLSTFLLERNRWNGKGPSMLVSEWIEPIAEAGFKGVEIWAPHLFFSSRSEWEAIREKTLEVDIPVAFLHAQLPTDVSDKSNRFRDSLIEAADYFDCQGLKFTFTGGGGNFNEKLSFAGEWMRDLPRDVQCLPVFEKFPLKTEGVSVYRNTLGSRFRCCIQPFSMGSKDAEKLFTEAGSDLINLGVRVVSGEGHGALRDFEKEGSRVISMAQRHDFKGYWTLETTSGVGASGEDIELLFDEAEEDLNFLSGALRRES